MAAPLHDYAVTAFVIMLCFLFCIQSFLFGVFGMRGKIPLLGSFKLYFLFSFILPLITLLFETSKDHGSTIFSFIFLHFAAFIVGWFLRTPVLQFFYGFLIDYILIRFTISLTSSKTGLSGIIGLDELKHVQDYPVQNVEIYSEALPNVKDEVVTSFKWKRIGLVSTLVLLGSLGLFYFFKFRYNTSMKLHWFDVMLFVISLISFAIAKSFWNLIILEHWYVILTCTCLRKQKEKFVRIERNFNSIEIAIGKTKVEVLKGKNIRLVEQKEPIALSGTHTLKQCISVIEKESKITYNNIRANCQTTCKAISSIY